MTDYSRRSFLRRTAAGAGAVAGLTAASTATAATYSIDTNLLSDASVSGAELDDAIAAVSPGSPLIGLGDTFIEVQRQTGVNAVYQAAHAAWESAWGTSSIAQSKYNIYGWSAYDSCPSSCAKTFDSFAACVKFVMPQIKDLYLEPGGTYYEGATLRGMNVHYATDSNWAEGIAGVMNSLADHLDLSEGSPKFETGQRVATTADLSVRAGAGVYQERITVVPAGSAGYVRGGPVEADGYTWYKVGYNAGYEGWSAAPWLSSAPLDTTKFDIGQRVHATTALNVRAYAGLDYDVAATVGADTGGWVKNGIITSDGYTWWDIAWDDGSRGWSVQKYVEAGTGAEGDFAWPISGTITSNYYDERSYGYHSSIDIANDRWTPIGVARKGTVSNVLSLDGGGRSVFVDHGAGYQTRYMHMVDWNVSEGQEVARGDTVGWVGSTGHSTGPHLHFEVERYGENQYVPGAEGAYVGKGEPIDQNYDGL